MPISAKKSFLLIVIKGSEKYDKNGAGTFVWKVKSKLIIQEFGDKSVKLPQAPPPSTLFGINKFSFTLK